MITKFNEYIKESLTTNMEIEKWLYKMNIINYTINNDLTVDVDGHVNISERSLTEIPVKFNKVDGSFYCFRNKLNSLEGCPTTINGYFDCHGNNLTSLKGCPVNIRGSFDCRGNKLISLKGCPTTINGSFFCHKNSLEDMNDLSSKILIKNINNIDVSQEVFDKYFEYWVEKDINIFEVLKDKVSNDIKIKYDFLFNAKNFDLI